MKPMPSVNDTAKSIIGEMLDKGFSAGEVIMTLSIAQQAIKKARI